MAIFTPNPNTTRGPTQASGSTHQFTGSVSITGSLSLNGSAIAGGGGSGDVSGPGSATDNAIVRFNGTGGKTIQNSSVTIDDSNNLGNATTLSASDGMSAGAVVTTGLATLAAVKVTAGPIWFHTGATHQIQNSNGDSNITLDTGDADVTIGGDLQVNGNDIKDAGGNAQFTFENGVGFTSGKATVMGGVVSTTISGSGALTGASLNCDGAATVGGTVTANKVTSSFTSNEYFSASVAGSTQAACNTYNIFNYGLTANVQITASNLVAGASYLFFIRQPAAGSKTGLFSGFKWPGGSAPTLSTAGNAVDVVSGISDGSHLYADITKAFS